MLLFCTYNAVCAQDNFDHVWDSTFRYVKQSGSLNTGCFWDLGMPDSCIADYRGMATDSLCSFSLFSRYYDYFRNSAVDVQNRVQAFEDFRQKLDGYFGSGIVPVPVLYAKGGMVAPQGWEKKLMQFDSSRFAWQTSDPANAFKLQEVFMATPYVQVSFLPEIKLLFSDQFIIGNSGLMVTKVEVLVRDGLAQAANKEQVFTIGLQPGDNLLRMRFTFSNGSIFESKVIVSFETADLNGGIPQKALGTGPFHFGDEKRFIYADPLRQTELQTPLGAFIDYLPGINNGVPNTCVLKPLVIVEGIDFGFENHMTGFYGGKCGNMGLIDLVNGYILNPYAEKSKDRKEYWDPITNAPRLIGELRNKGYDVFYVDFHNGAEFMENNAMLVVKFIQMLNMRKCSNEEIVVVGASMGGVVARYALSYMEKNNLPHCVRTYLSFDAPHQGANIPLGLQAFMQYFQGKLPGVKESFKRKIDRAATRQLLIYHILSDYRSTPHRDRKEFEHNLKSLGTYPKWSRNIALTNGSVNGSHQNFNPGDELLLMNPNSSKIDKNPIKFGANVYAMSRAYQQTRAIVMLTFMPLDKNDITEVEPDAFKPDHIPGSIRYDLKEARRIFGVFNILNRHSSACFIPSYSALDIRDASIVPDINGKLDRFVPKDSYYPFHTYYGVMHTNEEHMKMTNDNISWAVDEIEKNRNEIPALLSSKYNFGRFERYTLGSVSIESGGVLQINAHGLNGTGSGAYDRMNKKGSRFEMHSSDCNPVVIISQGGMLELGDVNLPVNNKAVLRFRKGSVLMIKSGGVLRIRNGSQLIIEDGAQLIYGQGAVIQLEGDDAQLQIDGKLRLETNAVFTISSGSHTRTGFVKFRNAKGGYGNASVEIGGANTGIDLKGTGMASDVLLQIEGEMVCNEGIGMYKLGFMKISDCKVLYGNRSRIVNAAEFTALNVAFDKLEWANKGSSDAIVLTDNEKAFFKACEFRNLNFGIKQLGSAQRENALEVRNSKFIHCVNGLYSRESRLALYVCVFDYCSENGLYVLDPETDVRTESCRFYSNETGFSLLVKNSKTRHLFVESCDFIKNATGLYTSYCHTAVACSRFLGNVRGLKDDLGELSISKDQTIAGKLYSMAGGNNTFGYNSGAGLDFNSTLLHLNNGYNNFLQQNGSNPCNYMTGVVAYSTATHEQSSPYALQAGNNFWQPAPANGLGSGAMTHYFIRFPYPGGGTTLNYMKGGLLNNLNTTCYNPGNCSSCDFTKQEPRSRYTVKATLDTLNFSIRPYPVSDLLSVDINQANFQGPVKLRLINLEGKVLAETLATDGRITLNTAGYSNGIYLLELTVNGNVHVRKMIINHGW